MSDTTSNAAIEPELFSTVQELRGISKLLGDRIAVVQEMTVKTSDVLERVTILIENVGNADKVALTVLREDVLPAIKQLTQDHTSLRVTLLSKVDHIQGTIDLMREDVRTNWQQADFAISNSRDGREDINRLLAMISTMQRQQNVLASQVDELRKAAQERDAGLN